MVEQVQKAVDTSHEIVVLHVQPHLYGPMFAACGAVELAMDYQDRVLEAEVKVFTVKY